MHVVYSCTCTQININTKTIYVTTVTSLWHTWVGNPSQLQNLVLDEQKKKQKQ